MPERILSSASSAAVVTVAALKEALLYTLGVVAALLVVEPALVGLFALLTLADAATVGFDKARRVGLRSVPGRLVAGPLARFLQALVVLVVSVAFANTYVLLGFLSDFAVAYVAWRAGAAALDHVLPADNEFRAVWDRVWSRLEQTLNPDARASDSPASDSPAAGPSGPSPEDDA